MRRKIFGSVLALFLSCVAAFSAATETASVPATEATPADAPAKVFYKISLQETCYIQAHEATINARATVEILQGDLDKISLEVFGVGSGQGEIFNVSGDMVKDWSLRRENNRTFLEIRHKAPAGTKSFKLTISGRQPVSLRASGALSPVLFSGVDSAAFFGIVQFRAPNDLRLHAKQERGLIPISVRDDRNFSYSIYGSPSLRIDVSRVNDMLAPVALENFSLTGDVGAEGTRFRLRAKASVRELGAEVPVLTGNAALIDFPASSEFVVLAKKDAKTGLPEYRLRFPSRGNFDVDLLFDAGIDDADGRRHMKFSVPVAQVAPYSLFGMPADTVFAAGNVSIPQADARGVFSGFLPSNGEFDLSWSSPLPMPREFSACVYSMDVVSEMQISTGVLKQKNEFDFGISQGSFSSLVFDIFGDGEILSVEGRDVVSWKTVSDGARRGLIVRLSQPKTEKYTLRIVSQTRNDAFPAEIRPLRFVPAQENFDDNGDGALASVCVRVGEFLRLCNGIGVRCEAVPQTGMTQVVASAFPRADEFFGKEAPASGVSVYRLSSGAENLRVKADFIRPDLSVASTVRWLFNDGKISSMQTVNFDVRDAPLYEMHVLVPDDLTPDSVDSVAVASYEISDDSGVAGYRLLKIVFSDPVIGAGRVSIIFRKNDSGADADLPTEFRSCLFPQARAVFGDTAVYARGNLRLLPVDTENLTEIPTEEFREKYAGKILPQLAFRVRDGAWKFSVRAEKRTPAVVGKSSCVYKIDAEKISANVIFFCNAGGVPVSKIRLAFPKNAKAISISGENVREWAAGADGVATVVFASEPTGEFSVAAEFEEPRADGVAQAFEGVALLDAVGDSGTILITSDKVASVSGGDGENAPAVLPPDSVSAADAARGGEILFRAFQFVERPFRLSLATRLPQGEAMPPLVVTEARVVSSDGQSCDVFYRYKNFGATDLRIEVPENVRVFAAGAKKIDGNVWSIPLPPGGDEILVRLAPKNPEMRAARKRKIELPRVFAPVIGTVFTGYGEAESGTMRLVSSGRQLNAGLGLPLLRRFAGAFFAGGAGIFLIAAVPCAIVAAAVSSQRKIARRIFLAIAFLAGTALSVFTAWCGTVAIVPDYGETILAAGMTDAGAALDVVLQRFYFLDGSATPTTFAAVVLFVLFCLGAGAVLFGAVSTSRAAARCRVVGRILAYAAFAIFALEDFPYRVPALAAAILVIEISAMLAKLSRKFFIKILGKISAANIASGVSACVGFFALALISLAISPDANAAEIVANDFNFSEIFDVNETKETPHDTADRISQSIIVLDDRVVARGDVRVSGSAGDRFDLLFNPAVLTSFVRRDGAMLRLERNVSEATGTPVYQIVLDRPGTFSADFSYELALPPNARGFQIPTGAAAADVATVCLPNSDVRISAEGAITVAPAPVVAEAGTITVAPPATEKNSDATEIGWAGQIAQIIFNPKAARAIGWNPRERDRAEENLRMFASGENLYVPSAGVIEGRHVLKFVPAQGEVSRVNIKIPESFSVSKIEGAAIHRWNFDRKTGMLAVLFTAPRVSEFSLSIFTQSQLSALPARKNFAALSSPDCVKQVRTIGLATDDSLQVDAVHADGLVPIDEADFFAALSAAGIKTEENLHLRRAFRTVDEKADFDAELSAVRPDLRVECDEKFSVNADFVRGEIDFSAAVSRAGLFKISFEIPAGTDIDSVSGDGLSYWTKNVPADGSAPSVTLHLKNALEGEKKFHVELSGKFPRDAETWRLPGFVVDDAKTQRGKISVAVDAGLRLRPISSAVAISDSAEADDARGANFSFEYFGRAGASPEFAVLESKPFATATWLHRVCQDGRFLRSNVKMIFDIENVMRTSVDVRLPAAARAVRFSGENIVAATPVEGMSGLWRLNFPKPIRGSVFADVEFFMPLPNAYTVAVPAVSVEGADRQNAWLAVERGGAFSSLKSHSPEKVSVVDVPENLREFLTENGASEDAWFVEKFAEKYPAEISVAHDAIAAWTETPTAAHRRSFLAKNIARATIFDKNHALTEERVSLDVKRSGVLRVVLPVGGTLKTATVDGAPAEIVFDPKSEGRVAGIPVFANDDARSVTVSLVYAHAPAPILFSDRKACEIVPAALGVAPVGAVSWSLRAIGDGVKYFEIFGCDPEKIRADATPSAEFLDTCFPDATGTLAAADFSKNFASEASPAETFCVSGTEIRKPSAVVVSSNERVARGDSAANGDGSAGAGFVLLAFVVLLILFAPKIVRSVKKPQAGARV